MLPEVTISRPPITAAAGASNAWGSVPYSLQRSVADAMDRAHAAAPDLLQENVALGHHGSVSGLAHKAVS